MSDLKTLLTVPPLQAVEDPRLTSLAPRTWVAEVLGPHPKWVVERSKLKPVIVSETEHSYRLRYGGVYDIQAADKRFFATVTLDGIVELTKNEACYLLNMPILVSQSMLIGRGWTLSKIEKLLGEPDQIGSSWIGRKSKLYSLERVEIAEATPEFAAGRRRKKTG